MWNFLREFEAGDFSSWVREGNFIGEPFSTYYTLLGLHSIGMAAIVGVTWMLSSRIFGFQQELPLRKVDKLITLGWWGFWLNLFSGVILLLAQPRREMMTTNFWIKILAIVLAVWVLRIIQKALRTLQTAPAADGTLVEVVPLSLRFQAFAIIALWLIAIVAGRLIGYTQPPPPM